MFLSTLLLKSKIGAFWAFWGAVGIDLVSLCVFEREHSHGRADGRESEILLSAKSHSSLDGVKRHTGPVGPYCAFFTQYGSCLTASVGSGATPQQARV